MSMIARAIPQMIPKVAKTATRALSSAKPSVLPPIMMAGSDRSTVHHSRPKGVDLLKENLNLIAKLSTPHSAPHTNKFTPFTSQDKAVKWTEKAAEISRLRPVLLTGPSGTGKTQIIKEVAKEQNTSLVRNVFSPYTSREDLFGQYQQVKDDTTGLLTFKFVDSPLVTAMKTGQWYLADEINLASATTLSALNDFLASDRTSFTNPISGESFKVHKNFRFFAACNPAESTTGRNQFSKEFQDRFNVVEVPPPSREDLLNFFEQKAPHIPLPLASKIIDFHLHISKMAESHDIGADGDSYAFSFRTLEKLVNRLKALSDKPNTISEGKAFFDQIEHLYLSPIRSEEDKTTIKHFMNTAFDHYDERLERTIDPDVIYDDDSNDVIEVDLTKVGHNVPPTSADPFVIGDSVRHTLNQVAWAIQHNENILLVSETGMGKTSLLKFLGELRDQHTTLVSIDEHTQPEDLFGHFVMGFDADTNEKTYTWKDGPVTTALKEGHLLIVDEINKANPAVLERLNDVLDSRKVVLYEKGDTDPIEANKHFQVAATANPSSTGDYACNDLSDPFKARFTIINISDPLTNAELVHLTKELLDHAKPTRIPKLLVSLLEAANVITSVRHLKDCIHSLNTHPEITLEICLKELSFLCKLEEKQGSFLKGLIHNEFFTDSLEDCKSLHKELQEKTKRERKKATLTPEEFTTLVNTQAETSHDPATVVNTCWNFKILPLKEFYKDILDMTAFMPQDKTLPELTHQYDQIAYRTFEVLNNLEDTPQRELMANKDNFVTVALYHALKGEEIKDITDDLAALFFQVFLKTNDDTPLKLLCHNPSDKLIQRLKDLFNHFLDRSDDPKKQNKELIQLAERLGQVLDKGLDDIVPDYLKDKLTDDHFEAFNKGKIHSKFPQKFTHHYKEVETYQDPTLEERVKIISKYKPNQIKYADLIFESLINGEKFNDYDTAYRQETLNLFHEYCENILKSFRTGELKESLETLAKSVYRDFIQSRGFQATTNLTVLKLNLRSTADIDHLILKSGILKQFGNYLTCFGSIEFMKEISPEFYDMSLDGKGSPAPHSTPTTNKKIEQVEQGVISGLMINEKMSTLRNLENIERHQATISSYLEEKKEEHKTDAPPTLEDTLQHPDLIQTVIKEVKSKLS